MAFWEGKTARKSLYFPCHAKAIMLKLLNVWKWHVSEVYPIEVFKPFNI